MGYGWRGWDIRVWGYGVEGMEDGVAGLLWLVVSTDSVFGS